MISDQWNIFLNVIHVYDDLITIIKLLDILNIMEQSFELIQSVFTISIYGIEDKIACAPDNNAILLT